MKIKKLLFSGSVAALLLPGLALAAFNDVSLGTSAIISIGGSNLNVYTTTAILESIVVGSSSFTVTLLPGSSIHIQSTDRLALATNAEPAYIDTDNNVCNSTESRLRLVSTAGTATITITPGTTCSGSTATGSSSSSASSASGSSGMPVGSGGGGGVLRAIVPQPATSAALAPTPSAPLPAAPVYGAIASEFGIGAKGGEVETLQTLLEAQGFLTMPAGVAKGTYGALTRAAVRAYQSNKGISQTGYIGPRTRAAMNADLNANIFATPSAPLPAAPVYGAIASEFGIGAKGDEVKTLQTLLETQGFLTMPAGVAKGTYGALTRAAVRAYQSSKGISQTGYIGPRTRAAMNADLAR